MHATGSRVRYTVCDNDGNHEPADKHEADEIILDSDKQWLDYTKWILEHGGDDPLESFTVRRFKLMRRNYVAYFKHGAKESRVCVTAVKWAGGKTKPGDLPEGFRRFLSLRKRKGVWFVNGITPEELSTFVPCVGKGYFKGTAEWRENVPEAAIRQQIIKLARRHVKLKETQQKQNTQ